MITNFSYVFRNFLEQNNFLYDQYLITKVQMLPLDKEVARIVFCKMFRRTKCSIVST